MNSANVKTSRSDAVGLDDRRIPLQRQEVHQRLGQVALLLEPGQPRPRVLPLRDLGLLLVAQQRHVREPRRLHPEPAVEQQVLRRRRDPLLAAHDVGDPHLVVVDDDGEVVGREAVGLEDHLVVRVRRPGAAHDEVVELELDVVGDEHPDHRLGREPRHTRAFVPGESEAEAVVARRLLRALLLLAHLREPLGRAPAVVGLALREEAVRIRPVGGEPLGLAVRRVGATDVRTLVPGEAQPVQRVVELPLAGRREPRPVGVLDPQHEPPTLLTGVREVEHRHVGGSDVRVAGRRRGDPQPDGTGRGGMRGSRAGHAHGSVSLTRDGGLLGYCGDVVRACRRAGSPFEEVGCPS